MLYYTHKNGIYKERITVATETFMKNMSFNRKHANALIKALENSKKPNRKETPQLNRMEDRDIIRAMFKTESGK